MTLRELYDHYARFQPEALDAEVRIDIEGDLSAWKCLEEHRYSARDHLVFLSIYLETEQPMEIINDEY